MQRELSEEHESTSKNLRAVSCSSAPLYSNPSAACIRVGLHPCLISLFRTATKDSPTAMPAGPSLSFVVGAPSANAILAPMQHHSAAVARIAPFIGTFLRQLCSSPKKLNTRHTVAADSDSPSRALREAPPTSLPPEAWLQRRRRTDLIDHSDGTQHVDRYKVLCVRCKVGQPPPSAKLTPSIDGDLI